MSFTLWGRIIATDIQQRSSFSRVYKLCKCKGTIEVALFPDPCPASYHLDGWGAGEGLGTRGKIKVVDLQVCISSL